jgi:hypothetical protein
MLKGKHKHLIASQHGNKAMKTLASCLTIVLISHASLALAQSGISSYRGYSLTQPGHGVPSHHYGFGAPVAGQIHHSSTYEEGVGRATAAMIQAQAQYNLLTSLALLNLAELQQKQFEFQQQQAAVRADMYRAYLERRDADLAARRSRIRSGKTQLAKN